MTMMSYDITADDISSTRTHSNIQNKRTVSIRARWKLNTTHHSRATNTRNSYVKEHKMYLKVTILNYGCAVWLREVERTRLNEWTLRYFARYRERKETWNWTKRRFSFSTVSCRSSVLCHHFEHVLNTNEWKLLSEYVFVNSIPDSTDQRMNHFFYSKFSSHCMKCVSSA